MVEVRIPIPSVPVVDPKTGLISREWRWFFHAMWQRSGGGGDKTGVITDDIGIKVQAFSSGLNTLAGLSSKSIGGLATAAELRIVEVTVNQSEVAAADQKILLDAGILERWKIRHALLSGDGTNFSGGGGDRNLAITDGTSTWSVIPAATLQSLAAARWGDTGLAFPATAAHLTAASIAGGDIVAKYSGGTADYTAGECTIILLAERTT